MHRVAVFIAEHLHFYMAGGLQVAFEEYGVVAEGALRLAFCAGDGVRQHGLVHDDAHPAPTAATRRLHQHGIADFARLRCEAGL